MIDLTDIAQVKNLQSNLRILDSEQGKEVMIFLEQLCGWYKFNEIETNEVLISLGKRQVLATIKTIMKSTPDQVVAIAKE